MRLLHAKSEILHEFFDDVPKYAILSHTWQEEELRFRDLNPAHCPWHMPETDEEIAARMKVFWSRCRSKAGYSKVHGCCQRAIKDGIEWVWVDTCCIDASSSSELQEAINSMYKWYTHAEVCYAYLLDVPPGQDAHAEASDFRKSRWHTRGWTLQELLAPKIVQFYDCEWNHIGEKSDLTQVLERCTGISGRYLSQSGRVYVRLASVAEKMSWAARRSTTRKEDIAYCLLGLFGVNMPMLYGEGTRAFGRLQEEIIRRSRDQSVIASNFRLPRPTEDEVHEDSVRWTVWTALASSPSHFLHSADARQRLVERPSDGFSMTQRGLRAHLPVYRSPQDDSYEYCILTCGISVGAYRGGTRLIAIPLVPMPNEDYGQDQVRDYGRMEMQIPIFVPVQTWHQASSRTFHIRRIHTSPEPGSLSTALAINDIKLPSDFVLAGVYPPQRFPFRALEFASNDADGVSKALIHIARQDTNDQGVLLVIVSEAVHYQRFLDISQPPGIAVVPVPSDYCVLDALLNVEPTKPVSLKSKPIELVALGLSPSAPDHRTVVTVEMFQRRMKNVLDIEVLENSSIAQISSVPVDD